MKKESSDEQCPLCHGMRCVISNDKVIPCPKCDGKMTSIASHLKAAAKPINNVEFVMPNQANLNIRDNEPKLRT